jgi:hypothetical protein
MLFAGVEHLRKFAHGVRERRRLDDLLAAGEQFRNVLELQWIAGDAPHRPLFEHSSVRWRNM